MVKERREALVFLTFSSYQPSLYSFSPIMIEKLVQQLKSLGTFYFCGNLGNLGDLLIAEATRQFFKRHGIQYIEYDPNNLPDEYNLVYGGGGRFVSYWTNSDVCIKLLTEPRIKQCVVLPHSFKGIDRLASHFDERHTLYCRDQASFEYLSAKAPHSSVYKLADMALLLKLDDLPPLSIPSSPSPEEVQIERDIKNGLFRQMKRGVRKSSVFGKGSLKGKRVAFLLRTDKEKSSCLDSSLTFDISVIWHTSGGDTAYNAEILRQFRDALRQADVVVSDRLHVCIMAYFSGLEVYMLDNIYGKLSGVYDLALKNIPQFHMLREGSLPGDLQEAWNRFSVTRRDKLNRKLRREQKKDQRKEMIKKIAAKSKEKGRVLYQALLKHLFRPTIEVQSVTAKGNKLTVTYGLSNHDHLKRLFKQREFVAEYSENIEKVPESVLVLPFVCNVLPIVWLLNGKLKVPRLDKQFYDSIPEFKAGYISQSPELNFAGKVEVEHLEDNSYERSDSVVVFFSGGVDAFATLFRHLEERPILLTISGADVKLSDTQACSSIEKNTVEAAEQFSLPKPVFVKTNMRTMIDEIACCKLVAKTGGEYWHGYQHGISIVSNAAPVCYLNHCKMVYIASTYTAENKVICASDPSIDNYVRICSTSVFHDAFELTRQMKLSLITSTVKKLGLYPFLRVCWKSSKGINCCKCEKCSRTIYGLLAENEDPRMYGFPLFSFDDDKQGAAIVNQLKTEKDHTLYFWEDIQERFRQTHAYQDLSSVNWIYSYNIRTK